MQQHTEPTSKQISPSHVADAAEIQAVLNQLSHALTAGDGRTAAVFWQAPALVLGDDHELAVAAPAEFERFFGGAREHYHQRGITDTHADIVRLEWITGRIALVTVRWPYLDAQGNELGGETSTYVLRRDDDGALKLRVALMHGEEADSAARLS